METKNIIAAIALSSAVIVLYSLFFIPEKPSANKNLVEKNKIEQNTDTPILDEKETLIQISREEALKQNERILFENQSIIGSISLKGAAIDDLTFKNYNTSLESNEKVTLLGPKNIEKGYLIVSHQNLPKPTQIREKSRKKYINVPELVIVEIVSRDIFVGKQRNNFGWPN